ncbi:Rz1-like lysis system protein LysC [Celerinatantimonas diazotrophica]
MLLSACSAHPPIEKVIVQTKYEKILPPREYIQPTVDPKPPSIPAVNDALVYYGLDLQAALQRCNADKRSLRQWQATQAK